jgi:hypothetical protein
MGLPTNPCTPILEDFARAVCKVGKLFPGQIFHKTRGGLQNPPQEPYLHMKKGFKMIDSLNQSLMGHGQMDQAIHALFNDRYVHCCTAVFNGEGGFIYHA